MTVSHWSSNWDQLGTSHASWEIPGVFIVSIFSIVRDDLHC